MIKKVRKVIPIILGVLIVGYFIRRSYDLGEAGFAMFLVFGLAVEFLLIAFLTESAKKPAEKLKEEPTHFIQDC